MYKDFSMKPNFRIRFDFSIKPVLQKRFLIQLCSTGSKMKKFLAKFYHEHPMFDGKPNGFSLYLVSSINPLCKGHEIK